MTISTPLFLRRVALYVAAGATLALAGCSTTLSADQLRQSVFPANALTSGPQASEVLPESEPDVMYLGAKVPTPVALGVPPQDPLPAMTLSHPVHLRGATLQEALSLLLADSSLPVLVAPGTPAQDSARIQGLRGPLPVVLKALSEAYGVFFSYSGGVLRVEPERTFTLDLPPEPELIKAVGPALEQRGATEVSVDAVSGNISYKANYLVEKSVEAYLASALTQPRLALELSIFEVRLSSSDQRGIQWNKFDIAGKNPVTSLLTKATSTGASAAGTMSLAGTLGKKLTYEALVDFLSKQGSVKTVSQPRVNLLSGQATTIKIGDVTRYVSKVGAAQVGSSNASQTTSETTELETGMELGVSGRWWQDTVMMDLSLKMSELLGFETMSTGENQTLKLPQTTKRDLGKHTLRLRPGESGLLFGYISTKEASSREGLTNAPLLGALTATRAEGKAERSELVVLVRPRVVHFGAAPDSPAEGTK